MDKRSERDLLSNLPLSIIHSILTFVPIRDAVKTSILSRQWRYIWATLPHLVFDDFSGSEETGLNHFITQALSLHKGPIRKFKLHVSSFESCSIDQWLLLLSRYDIRMLILNLEDYDGWFKIHSSIYSCEKLIHLELVSFEIPPPPPTFKGFLCLRCLFLENVDAHSSTIESLVANSPLLEELTFSDDSGKKFGSSELKIHAPNLKYFFVQCEYKEICLHAPLLAKLLFYMYFTAEHLLQKSSACNYTKFLGGLTNLEELSGNACLIKYLSIGVEPCHHSLVFHRLRVIDLGSVMFDDVKQIWVVVHLITGAPNLHKLKISYGFNSKLKSEVASISFWDSEFAPNFRFERLKVIEMRNVPGELNQMKLVKFLLASSPMLETLTLKPSIYLTDHKLLNLTRELLSCRRASTNAQILFSKVEEL